MNLLPSFEIWKWIPKYEGRFEISNRGRIRSWVINGGVKGRIGFIGTPRIKKLFANKWGYSHTTIGNESRGDNIGVRAHRLVGVVFCQNPENKAEVNHINGIKSCNEWWNFEWVTRLESIEHAFKTGLIKPALGEKQSTTKLKNEQVMEIYKSDKPKKELATLYGVSLDAIWGVQHGRTWWHLTGHKRYLKPSEQGKFKQRN